jgi:hypothetical protein
LGDAGARQSDLIDALCDALDEYAAGGVDLATLVRDVDSVIVELAPLSDPTWIGELRDHERTLAGALQGAHPSQTSSLSSSALERSQAAAAALRHLLTAEHANV